MPANDGASSPSICYAVIKTIQHRFLNQRNGTHIISVTQEAKTGYSATQEAKTRELQVQGHPGKFIETLSQNGGRWAAVNISALEHLAVIYKAVG